MSRADETDRTEDAWMLDAACRGTDPDLFYPNTKAGPSGRHALQAALSLCAECPVRQECRDAARNRGEKFGIWGGEWLEETNRDQHARAARRHDENRGPR